MEKVGLACVLEDAAFQQGLKRYISGLGQMESRTTQVSAVSSSALGGIGSALLNSVGAAVGTFVGQILPRLVSGVNEAISAVANVASEAIMTAARVDEMTVAVNYLGAAAGYSAVELASYIEQIRDAGMRTDVAQTVVAEFTRYNLDLAKALNLVRIAQGAAGLANEDSSDTMAALTDGILTQNTLILRRRGIVVNMGAEMEKFGAAHGKAAEDLTDTERAQAALNAVLKVGQPLIGLYPELMESASKQLRSMPRYVYELQLAMGAPFQTTFKGAVFLLVDFMAALTDAAREGGVLNVILTELGSTIQTLTAPLVGWGRGVIGIMQDINSVFGGFKGPNLTVLTANIGALQRKIQDLQPPDLASGWGKQVDEIEKLNRDLGASITGIWEDVNRAITQATQDRNTQLGREEADWLRSQERAVADHRDSIAQMYEDLEDTITDMRRDRAKEREQAQEAHETDMEQLRRDAGMAETKEEWDLIQELMAKKETQFQEEQSEAEKAFQAELRQERRRVKERVAIQQLEFDQKNAREGEDRQIRLQREEQDFQLRITRQNEEAARREADMKAASAERMAVLQAEIAAGKTAREEGYAQEKAALQAQLAAAKREYEKSLFELPFLHEQHAKEAAKAYERLSELFAAQLGIEFGEIKKAWDEKDWGSLGLSAILTIWKLDWQLRNRISTAVHEVVGAISIQMADAIVRKTSEISNAWVITMETAVGNAVRAIRDHLGDFWETGFQAIKGFVEGFLYGAQWAQDVVRDVIGGAVQAALDALGIGSPSKLFLGIGQNLSASLAEGIRSMGHLPAFEMQRVAAGTMHSVTNYNQPTYNYSLQVNTSAPVEPIVSDYRMMQVMAG
jgi:hypothetical protein